MGKRTARRSRTAHVDYDNDDDNTGISFSRPKPMQDFLENLFEKRGSTREHGLASIIEGFTNNLQRQFAEKNFATILYRCLNGIKRGSDKEISLASHVVGLLAMTIGCGDSVHELYEEALPQLSKALRPGSESSKISSILYSLAIVTFVGGTNSEEIETSMNIIWQFLHSNVATSKHSVVVVATAVSAWSFLLTALDGWRVNYNYWKGAVSYFFDLLEEGDDSIHVAAGEALSLIFEMGCLKKFYSEAGGSTDGNTSSDGYTSVHGFKDNILKRARSLSNANWDVLKFFEDGYCPVTSMKIAGLELTLSTCSQLIQLYFLKRFLGSGFVKHMRENDFLRDVFELTPRKHLSGHEQYISRDGEVSIHFYLPEVRKKDCVQRIYRSPNSVLNKARTQLLDKKRVLSQGRNFGHYAVDDA